MGEVERERERGGRGEEEGRNPRISHGLSWTLCMGLVLMTSSPPTIFHYWITTAIHD